MIDFLKFYFFRKEITVGLGISILLLIIRYLGLMQPIEWAFHDWLFYIKPTETTDQRIVIVYWDEAQIRNYKEGIISDAKLLKILQKIKAQNPSIIGLDIYRDTPVAEFDSSRKENHRAYEQLHHFLGNTDNLVGIAKIIKPTIEAPPDLKKRTTAADLLIDDDGFLRRGWLYPDPENPAKIPSLGLSVAAKYLSDRGLRATDSEDGKSLLFKNEENRSSLVVKPSLQFDGSYIRWQEGVFIIVNWRKNNVPFQVASVREILEERISPNIFTDKIVLIGNTSASGADQHFLPLDRWQNTLSQTNGVEIHAHIASSIIAAALDERPWIEPIPEIAEILLVIFTTGIIIFFSITNTQQKSPATIFLISSGVGVFLIIFLISISSIAFLKAGYYIPVMPAILSSLVSPSIACISLYIYQIEEKNKSYLSSIKKLNHSIPNFLNSILLNVKMASDNTADFKSMDFDESMDALYRYEIENESALLADLHQNVRQIGLFAQKIQEDQEQIREYIKLIATEQKAFLKKSVIFNRHLHDLITKIITLKKEQYHIEILLTEKYDPEINSILIEKISFDLAIESLLDNAIFAIKEKAHNNPKYTGKIEIQTKNQKNKILLTIKDNGTGINSQALSQIFDEFYSNKTSNEGQGLGLTLTKETIQRHRGKIIAQSILGKGSTFTLFLPK